MSEFSFSNVYSCRGERDYELRVGVVVYDDVSMAASSADTSGSEKWLGVIDIRTGDFTPANPPPTEPTESPPIPHRLPVSVIPMAVKLLDRHRRLRRAISLLSDVSNSFRRDTEKALNKELREVAALISDLGFCFEEEENDSTKSS